MKTHLIRVGNSRGVRLPKPLIEEAGLTDAVEIRVRDGTIVIAGVARARSGWAEAAQRMREREDGLLDPPTSTRFDEGEWKW
jgi:antitoxin MazE